MENVAAGWPYVAYSKNGKWAYFDCINEQFITGHEYDSLLEITWPDNEVLATKMGEFGEKGWYCPVKKDDKYGYINIEGNLVTPMEFDGATNVQGGKAWVKMDGMWGQIEFVTD